MNNIRIPYLVKEYSNILIFDAKCPTQHENIQISSIGFSEMFIHPTVIELAVRYLWIVSKYFIYR